MQTSYPAGYVIAASGFFLHFLAQLVLLCGYCFEKGCFVEGCQGPPPTRWSPEPQCLPPQSDTYIIYEPTFAQHSRRIVMLVIVCMRSILEPWLGSTTHNLLLSARHKDSCCSVLRSLFFVVAAILNSVLDLLSVIFWNQGRWMGIHKVLSTWLMLEWVFLIGPPYNIALCGEGSRRSCLGASIIWLVVVLCFALGCGLHFGYNTTSWLWYLGEWILISTQGIAISIAGVALPRSYRIKRQWTLTKGDVCRPLQWQVPCGLEVVDDPHWEQRQVELKEHLPEDGGVE
mmetsp:Transcript_48004/g.88364  ORF Transcript_48004/g.88364 Transcript_48004/m.88364 type:complete len:287 (+) Transcript_48004:114-974(+)